MYDARTVHGREVLARVVEAFGDKVFLTVINRTVKFPDFEREYQFVAMASDDEYPMNLGRIKSNTGLDLDHEEFGHVLEEYQVPHSTSLHSRLKDRGPYLLGPLARLKAWLKTCGV